MYVYIDIVEKKDKSFFSDTEKSTKDYTFQTCGNDMSSKYNRMSICNVVERHVIETIEQMNKIRAPKNKKGNVYSKSLINDEILLTMVKNNQEDTLSDLEMKQVIGAIADEIEFLQKEGKCRILH